MTTFEEFSSGYYLGRLRVAPGGGSRARLHAGHHERVCEQLYGDGEAPLVMRYDCQHFVVDGDGEVPERTLAVPGSRLDPGHDPTEPREVFLAKADRAEQLLGFAVGSGDDGPASGDPFAPDALGDAFGPRRPG